MGRRELGALALLWSASAQAQELREFCTTRPSLGTSACIVDRGHVTIELGVADRQRESDADTRTTRFAAGDALVRFGVTETAEVQLGWTAYGRVTERDRMSGDRARRSGVGDVTLAWRQNLRRPDGSGFSWGVQPFASLPTGRYPVGGGDWGGGVVVPVSYELSDTLKLVLDPEVDAAVDGDGSGRHLAYGNVAGLEVGLSKAVAVTLELSAFRDRDPKEPVTETLGAVSATWQPTDDLQLDAGVVAGLNRHSPDLRLLTGISARF